MDLCFLSFRHAGRQTPPPHLSPWWPLGSTPPVTVTSPCRPLPAVPRSTPTCCSTSKPACMSQGSSTRSVRVFFFKHYLDDKKEFFADILKFVYIYCTCLLYYEKLTTLMCYFVFRLLEVAIFWWEKNWKCYLAGNLLLSLYLETWFRQLES